MRKTTLETYKTVHTWTGIVAGLALFIAFFAGALTIFKDALKHWATPPIEQQTEIHFQQVPGFIAEILKQYPKAGRDIYFEVSDLQNRKGELSFQLVDPASDHDVLSNKHYTVSADDQGNALIQQVYPSQISEFIDVLHRVVGLPLDIDEFRWIMGVIALLYALALVSGVIIFFRIC